LEGDAAAVASSNMRRFRAVLQQSDLVPVEYIDRDAPNEAAARTIDEVLDIFVRVNTGGTRLSRSDLMFSIIKRHWASARVNFDELVAEVERTSPLGIDKDFVIAGFSQLPTRLRLTKSRTSNGIGLQFEQVFDAFARSLKNTLISSEDRNAAFFPLRC